MEKKDREVLKREKISFLKAATGADFSTSFYFPVQKKGHILDAAFLYASGINAVKRTRPFGMIIVDPSSGNLLEYKNSYIDDFMDFQAFPMDMEVDYSVPAAQSAREQGKLIEQVNGLYPKARLLAFQETWSKEDEETAKAYGFYFHKAVPKELIPFYQALSPEFYERVVQYGGHHQETV